MEIWTCPLDILGYEVSLQGRVKNTKTGTIRGGKFTTVPINGVHSQITPLKIRKLYFHYDGLWKNQLDDGEKVVPLTGFPGYYITSYARVYCEKNDLWITPQNVTNTYYHRFSLRSGGKHVGLSLSTQVGRHFLEGYEEGLFICHKDETLPYPQIHSVDNLFLGTPSENHLDLIRKKRCPRQKLTWEDVRFMRKFFSENTMPLLEMFEEMSQKFGCSVSNIRSVYYENSWKPHTDPSQAPLSSS